ncbi:MAG: hypothetical protein IPM92_14565 [Saprospiraceae bacterium]|nr:hypothetical protein [Saprospiraceae bacterium]
MLPFLRAGAVSKKLKIAKSLKLLMKKNIFLYSVDCNFLDVMLQCKTVARHGEHGSWIHGDIIKAFSDLHEKGLAHSLEICEYSGQNEPLIPEQIEPPIPE